MPGVAEGETPDGEAVRVQALKNTKGVNFLRPVFEPNGALLAIAHREDDDAWSRPYGVRVRPRLVGRQRAKEAHGRFPPVRRTLGYAAHFSTEAS